MANSGELENLDLLVVDRQEVNLVVMENLDLDSVDLARVRAMAMAMAMATDCQDLDFEDQQDWVRDSVYLDHQEQSEALAQELRSV